MHSMGTESSAGTSSHHGGCPLGWHRHLEGQGHMDEALRSAAAKLTAHELGSKGMYVRAVGTWLPGYAWKAPGSRCCRYANVACCSRGCPCPAPPGMRSSCTCPAVTAQETAAHAIWLPPSVHRHALRGIMHTCASPGSCPTSASSSRGPRLVGGWHKHAQRGRRAPVSRALLLRLLVRGRKVKPVRQQMRGRGWVAPRDSVTASRSTVC